MTSHLLFVLKRPCHKESETRDSISYTAAQRKKWDKEQKNWNPFASFFYWPNEGLKKVVPMDVRLLGATILRSLPTKPFFLRNLIFEKDVISFLATGSKKQEISEFFIPINIFWIFFFYDFDFIAQRKN